MRLAIVLAAAALLAACTMKPLVDPAAEPYQITEVTVALEPGVVGGTLNFPEAMRVNTQNEAYKFSEEGREKRLELTVTGLQLYDPVRTILISGTTYVAATGNLYDIETGTLDATFQAQGVLPNQGGLVMALVMPMMANVYDEEQKLSKLFAINAMHRLYGSAYASSVAGREPTRQAVANYPVSYEKIQQEIDCRIAFNRNTQQTSRSDETREDEPLPEFCAEYGYEVEPG